MRFVVLIGVLWFFLPAFFCCPHAWKRTFSISLLAVGLTLFFVVFSLFSWFFYLVETTHSR